MCNDPIDNTEVNKGGFFLGTEEVTKIEEVTSKSLLII